MTMYGQNFQACSSLFILTFAVLLMSEKVLGVVESYNKQQVHTFNYLLQ